LRLTQAGWESVQFVDRLLTFDGDNATVTVGGATKEQVPAATNAFFK
jgi:hypothetical protein